MSDLSEAVISEVKISKSERAVPILAEFQNGRIQDTSGFSAQRVIDSETKKQFILAADDTAVYRSSIGEGFGNSVTNTFLAIRNKRTNKIRMIQMEEASLKSIHYDSLDEYSRPVALIDKNTALREFGGKNATRYLDRINRTKPNVEVVTDFLEKTVDDIQTDKLFTKDISDLSSTDQEQLRNSLFPTVNQNAKTVQEKYTISNLIPNDLLEHLEIVTVEILKGDLDKVPLVNNYLKNCVKEVQMSKEPDSPENLTRVKICLYIDGLIRLINVKNYMLDKLELSKISERIEMDIKERFGQADTKNRLNSKFTRQKSIIYYLLLVLMTTPEYEIHIDNVMENLNLSKTELLTFAKVVGIGCKKKTILYLKLNVDTKSLLKKNQRTNRKR